MNLRHSLLKSLLVVAALAVAWAGTVQAQATSGNISGDALAGETVVVNGPDFGYHREIKMEDDGKYSVRHVPAGSYTVVRIRPDGSVASSKAVIVQAGATARVM